MLRGFLKNRTRTLLSALGVAAAVTVVTPVHAALVNVSGEIVNPNATIGVGNTANFTGPGYFSWQTGNSSIDVITNGFPFGFDSGGGNPLNYSGSVSGASDVFYRMAPEGSGLANNALIVSGATANTYTGTSYIDKGHVQLQKTAGVNALPGNVSIGGQGNNDRLTLGASHQIADSSVVTLASFAKADFTTVPTSTLNLNGFSETVNRLQVNTGGVVTTGTGGTLTANSLIKDGVALAAGVYNSGNASWVTGSGSVTVLGSAAPELGKFIGLNFAGATTDPGSRKALTSLLAAGAPGYVQANWNNTFGNGQTGDASNGINPNMLDSNGTMTTLDVRFDAFQTWGANHGSNPTNDQRLMGNGITDGAPLLTISQVPFSQYEVVVYLADTTNRNSTITLTEGDGDVFQRFVVTPNFTQFVGYDKVLDTATSTTARDAGNYIVFTGLNASSFTLSATAGGFAAIQIVNTFVPVPEPTTLGLLGLGAVALARRSRNRIA